MERTVWVRLLRATVIDGRLDRAGTLIECRPDEADELIAERRAVSHPAPPAAAVRAARLKIREEWN